MASEKSLTTPVFGEPFPPVIIGGPSGDYKVLADVTSCRWMEYQVVNVAASGPGSVVVSGKNQPKALDYSGAAATAINDDAHQYGEAYAFGGSGNSGPSAIWRRITSSEKRVYVRIDCNAGNSYYVTLRFRPCLLEIIPGPSMETHPDHPETINKLRTDTINQRLGDIGIPGYASETNKGAKD